MISIDTDEYLEIRINKRHLFTYTKHKIIAIQRVYCSRSECTQYEFVPISLENLENCSQGSFSVYRMRQYLEKQSERIKGFFLRNNDGDYLGYIWIAFRGADEFQYRIRHLDAFFFDVCVFPQYRGNGIMRQMFSMVFDELEKYGIDVVYGAVRPNNLTALRAYQKLHCQVYKKKSFIRFLRWNIPYYTL